jgi:hypothetical protein
MHTTEPVAAIGMTAAIVGVVVQAQADAPMRRIETKRASA